MRAVSNARLKGGRHGATYAYGERVRAMGGSKRKRAFLVVEIDIFSNILLLPFCSVDKIRVRGMPGKVCANSTVDAINLVMLADSEMKPRGTTKKLQLWACDWETDRKTLFSLVSLQCERTAPEAGQLGRSTVHLLVGLVAHVLQCPILAFMKQDGRSS